MRKNSKPLYYQDYILDSNSNKKNYGYGTFIILLTIFVFLISIIDLTYSYLDLDICQNKIYILSLNSWLRINGIYGFFYYIFMIVIVYFIFYYDNDSDKYEKGYNKLVNNTYVNLTNEKTKELEKIYKFFSFIFTFIWITSLIIGSYIFFSFFGKECKSYAINIYMWFKLISSFLSSLFFIFYICKD